MRKLKEAGAHRDSLQSGCALSQREPLARPNKVSIDDVSPRGGATAARSDDGLIVTVLVPLPGRSSKAWAAVASVIATPQAIRAIFRVDIGSAPRSGAVRHGRDAAISAK